MTPKIAVLWQKKINWMFRKSTYEKTPYRHTHTQKLTKRKWMENKNQLFVLNEFSIFQVEWLQNFQFKDSIMNSRQNWCRICTDWNLPKKYSLTSSSRKVKSLSIVQTCANKKSQLGSNSPQNFVIVNYIF